MKILVFLFASLLCAVSGVAQSIKFTEYDSNPILTDARNGDVAYGDIDNDGDPDLLVIGQDLGVSITSLYRNDGFGLFSEIIGTSILDFGVGTVNFADVDNDGDQDFIIAGRGASIVYRSNLYLNDGVGNFTLDMSTPFVGHLDAFSFEDVDNDGDLDVLFIGDTQDANFNYTPSANLYLNDGSGVFTEQIGHGIEGLGLGGFEFVDIDNDNDQDVIATGRDSNDVYKNQVYTNDGNGIFTLTSTNAFTACSFADIAVGDADNDGDQDVLINGRDVATSLRVTEFYTNDGSGNFTEFTGMPFVPSDLGELTFADLDNDGDQDVLVTGDIEGNFIHAGEIYENQGGSNFVLSDSLQGAYFGKVDMADMNGDGFLDIVFLGIAQGAPGSIYKPRTYLNNGVIASDIDLLLDSDGITLFPNPTLGFFEIEGLTSNYTIQILDSNGVVHQTLTTPLGNIIVDISTLPAGLYFIQAINNANAELSFRKILKQ